MYNIYHNILKNIYIYRHQPWFIYWIMETFSVIPSPTKVPARQSRQQALHWQRSNTGAMKQWIHNSCRAIPARSRAQEAMTDFNTSFTSSAVSVKCMSISHGCRSALFWMAIHQSKWLTSWVLRFIEHTYIYIFTFRIWYTYTCPWILADCFLSSQVPRKLFERGARCC